MATILSLRAVTTIARIEQLARVSTKLSFVKKRHVCSARREEKCKRKWGFLQPAKRGRPPIYATEEERKAAFRAQQRVCMKKHAERVKEAKRCMLEAQGQNLNVAVQT